MKKTMFIFENNNYALVIYRNIGTLPQNWSEPE